MKWQIDKTVSWQIGTLMEKEVSQMENRQNGNFTENQVEWMQIVLLKITKVSIWQLETSL